MTPSEVIEKQGEYIRQLEWGLIIVGIFAFILWLGRR